jgi:hypothetical protein
MELTVRQAARRLGVTPARIRQFVMEGRIKPRYLTPRMMLIDARELAKVRNRKPGRPRKKKGR